MSEVVVRMEMPTACEGCWIPSYKCKWRSVAWYLRDNPTVGYINARHPDCPIICQLPEGHGRLVDADALNSILEHRVREGFTIFTVRDTVEASLRQYSPTIVPAERSEP